MDDEGVKSALELAMERVSGLPALTPEEIAEQKEKEHRTTGEAIGYRYMQGLLNVQDLMPELQRYPGDPGRIVRKYFVKTLVESIQFERLPDAEKALEGLLELAGERPGFAHTALSSWRDLLKEYELYLKERTGDLEAQAREALAELGISGSAARPNLEENAAYVEALAGYRRSFEPRLQAFRSMLIDGLCAAD